MPSPHRTNELAISVAIFELDIYFSLMYALLAAQDPEENTWEPLENLGEAEKAIKLFEKEQVTNLRKGNYDNLANLAGT